MHIYVIICNLYFQHFFDKLLKKNVNKIFISSYIFTYLVKALEQRLRNGGVADPQGACEEVYKKYSFKYFKTF